MEFWKKQIIEVVPDAVPCLHVFLVNTFSSYAAICSQNFLINYLNIGKISIFHVRFWKSYASAHLQSLGFAIGVDSQIQGQLFEFSHNTHSWQHWHFCVTSNGNILKMVESQVNFNANSNICHGCFWLKLRWLISLSYLFPNICTQYKIDNIANFVYYGKTRVGLLVTMNHLCSH